MATGAVSLLAGLAIGGAAGSAFVALGLVLPALLLQDSWRFAFFAAGQGRKAFSNDMVWALTLVPAMFAGGRPRISVRLLAGVGVVRDRRGGLRLPAGPDAARPVRHRDWMRQHRDLGLRYMVENVSISSAAQLRMYGLGAIAGLADVGAVRGGQLLLGPFLALLMGMSLVAVPEAARVLRRAPRRLTALLPAARRRPGHRRAAVGARRC